jgi:RimJ/RimL family protein N-acetyltransferase
VSHEREPSEPIGLGTSGTWIELEPLSPENAAEFDQLDARRELEPAMAASRSPRSSSPFGAPMLVRERTTGRAVGTVSNRALPGRVAVFVVYLDPELSRRGYGLEAVFMYVAHLFDSGARLVTAEVMEFNREMMAINRKVGLEVQARLREHVFSAGQFWDLVIYSFDVNQFRGMLDRYRRALPGGSRSPSAIGGTRRIRP